MIRNRPVYLGEHQFKTWAYTAVSVLVRSTTFVLKAIVTFAERLCVKLVTVVVEDAGINTHTALDMLTHWYSRATVAAAEGRGIRPLPVVVEDARVDTTQWVDVQHSATLHLELP